RFRRFDFYRRTLTYCELPRTIRVSQDTSAAHVKIGVSATTQTLTSPAHFASGGTKTWTSAPTTSVCACCMTLPLTKAASALAIASLALDQTKSMVWPAATVAPSGTVVANVRVGRRPWIDTDAVWESRVSWIVDASTGDCGAAGMNPI